MDWKTESFFLVFMFQGVQLITWSISDQYMITDLLCTTKTTTKHKNIFVYNTEPCDSDDIDISDMFIIWTANIYHGLWAFGYASSERKSTKYKDKQSPHLIPWIKPSFKWRTTWEFSFRC